MVPIFHSYDFSFLWKLPLKPCFRRINTLKNILLSNCSPKIFWKLTFAWLSRWKGCTEVGDVITNGISKKNLKLKRELGVTGSTRDADPYLLMQVWILILRINLWIFTIFVYRYFLSFLTMEIHGNLVPHPYNFCVYFYPVFRIRIRIHVFLGLPDPDPLVRDMDPDPALDADPDPPIIMQK